MIHIKINRYIYYIIKKEKNVNFHMVLLEELIMIIIQLNINAKPIMVLQEVQY